MKKNRIKRVLAGMLSAFLVAEAVGGTGFLNENPGVVYADTQRSATVNATTLNVRSGPGTGNSIVKKLSHGAAVTVIGETKDSAGTTWYKIRFTSGASTLEGYASSAYIKFPVSYAQDSDFETYMRQQGFPESYKESLRALHAEHPTWVFQAQKTGLDWNTVIDNESLVGANLVDTGSISSWKSTEYGAYDWNTGKWTGFDGATWVAASEEIVAYYMDPRNFLNDTYVFQFLKHSYDSAHQTKEGLKSMVKGTFLEKEAVSVSSGSVSGTSVTPGTISEDAEKLGPGYVNRSVTSETSGGPGATGGPGASGNSGTVTAPGTSGSQSGVSLEGPSQITSSIRGMQILATPTVEYGPGMDASSITGDNTGASSTSPVPEGQTYVDIIMKAAAESGVNPYVIAAMIIQEQGNGKSGSISGTTAGYVGYYNFFNIGAYQSGSMSAVTRGLWYASQSGSYDRPWNSIEKSIVGGSKYYGENYVKAGQDTFYLKKFNVQGSNLYKHQYMTNVEAAAGEGAKLSRAYTDTMKSETLVFKIPVFNNMPETACAKPTVTGSPNNKLSALSVNGYALTPTFNMNTESYDVIVNPSVEKIAINAATVDAKAVVSGAGTVNLQSGNNTISVEVKAENGDVRVYKLNVVRKSDAPVVNVTQSSGGSSNGPGAPGSSSVVVQGSANGPGAPSSNVKETTAAVKIPETTAAQTVKPQETKPAVIVTPQDMGGRQDVEVGVGPGGSIGSTTSQQPGGPGTTQTVVPETSAAIAAPVETTAAPRETSAPTTAAPTTAAPTTAAPQQTTAASTEAALKKGDCNGDGKVTIQDLILIKKQILGQNVLSGAKKKAADMNGDGKITSSDATALQKLI